MSQPNRRNSCQILSVFIDLGERLALSTWPLYLTEQVAEQLSLVLKTIKYAK